MYINYHPTDEFPVNLETVFHIIGFANKGNAKKTLENNFTLDEDYKIILLTRDKKQNTNNLIEKKAACADGEATLSINLGGSGLNKEEIMLNTDTFKSLCMIAKTGLPCPYDGINISFRNFLKFIS